MASALNKPGRGVGLRRRSACLLAAIAALAGWRTLDQTARSHLIFINRSPSLPNWAYIVERGAQPARGMVSFFKPPRGKLIEMQFGSDPAPFGKIAYGLPGDRVERDGNRVFVIAAGSRKPRQVGVLKPVSARGARLAAGPTGVIPAGCYYMGSPHRDGFDSRYAAIGFVCRGQIIGTARQVIL